MLAVQAQMFDTLKLENEALKTKIREQKYALEKSEARVEKLSSYFNDLGLNQKIIEENSFWWSAALKFISIKFDPDKTVNDPAFANDQQQNLAKMVAKNVISS